MKRNSLIMTVVLGGLLATAFGCGKRSADGVAAPQVPKKAKPPGDGGGDSEWQEFYDDTEFRYYLKIAEWRENGSLDAWVRIEPIEEPVVEKEYSDYNLRYYLFERLGLRSIDAENYSYTLLLMGLDCSDRSAVLVQWRNRNRLDQDLKEGHGRDLGVVVPGTFEYAMMYKFCPAR